MEKNKYIDKVCPKGNFKKIFDYKMYSTLFEGTVSPQLFSIDF